MLLYHGTIRSFADTAFTDGIKPRGQGPGNWPDRPSRPDCVYLTDAFGATYAVASSIKAGEPDTAECAIIEVEAPDDGNLLPDEDFLTECVLMSYKEGEFDDPGDTKKHALSASLRDSLEAYAGTDWLQVLRELHKDQYKPIDEWVQRCAVDERGNKVRGWESSVIGLGSCAYKGVVAAGRIRRIAYIPRSHIILQQLQNENVKPSIYEYQQKRGRLLTSNALIFGDPPFGPQHGRFREGIRVVRAVLR
jgi:hypothetical protein